MCQISKFLFGTLDENDADYDEQIRKFEENSDDMTDLLKQQVSVIKTTLGTFSNTLIDIQRNDKLVQKGLLDIKTYLDTLAAETARTLSMFEAKFMIERHITQVNNALTTLQRNIDVVLDSVHAQSGIVQPQIVPPGLLLDSLKGGQSFFPPDTILPFPLSKDSNSLIYKVCEIHVYLQNERLNYVINIPLENKGEFRAYCLVPVPLLVNKDKLIYIKIGESVLYVDNVRQYYYLGSEDQLRKCKEPAKRKYVCRQEKTPPIQFSARGMCSSTPEIVEDFTKQLRGAGCTTDAYRMETGR